jgi:hypothetical protein
LRELAIIASRLGLGGLIIINPSIQLLQRERKFVKSAAVNSNLMAGQIQMNPATLARLDEPVLN